MVEHLFVDEVIADTCTAWMLYRLHILELVIDLLVAVALTRCRRLSRFLICKWFSDVIHIFVYLGDLGVALAPWRAYFDDLTQDYIFAILRPRFHRVLLVRQYILLALNLFDCGAVLLLDVTVSTVGLGRLLQDLNAQWLSSTIILSVVGSDGLRNFIHRFARKDFLNSRAQVIPFPSRADWRLDSAPECRAQSISKLCYIEGLTSCYGRCKRSAGSYGSITLGTHPCFGHPDHLSTNCNKAQGTIIGTEDAFVSGRNQQKCWCWCFNCVRPRSTAA